MTETLFNTNETKMETLKNRHELVFIYDSKYSNPNGDPMENNELRIINDRLIVTDVRFKRTIRDYLAEQNIDIFVIEKIDKDGKVIDVKGRLKDTIGVKSEKDIKPEHIKELLKQFVDIRLFGSAIKMKLTGPVQFNFGESMHKINQVKISGTTVFSSGDNKGQGTFTEMFISPYTIIAFHGVINEKGAEKTTMTEEDLSLLKEAIWNGTKNLITRSKFEQLPRLLVDIKFKEGVKTHIGELDKYIKLVRNENILDERFIQDIQEVSFDFTDFVNRIKDFENDVESIEIKKDKRVKIENLPKEIESIQVKIEEI